MICNKIKTKFNLNLLHHPFLCALQYNFIVQTSISERNALAPRKKRERFINTGNLVYSVSVGEINFYEN